MKLICRKPNQVANGIAYETALVTYAGSPQQKDSSTA
jgi:hypothetical protein